MKNTSYITWTGWGVFFFSLVVYLMTVAPTASFWDCGEFIACSNELEVTHPPGAPLFLLLGRLMAMTAFSPAHIAFHVNLLSVFSGAFTSLFVCWICMLLAKRGLANSPFISQEKKLGILFSGVVAGLCCTFADAMWWNAVEAEVYAMSSFFTAIVVWLMLKWQERADQPDHLKWIILIAYLMGLSIGVHLLNLLTIPALALMYYYRKFPFSWRGLFATLALAVFALLFIQYGVIQYSFKLAWEVEKLFTGTVSLDNGTVTGWGFPKGTGAGILAAMVVLVLMSLLIYSHLTKRVALNTLLLCFTVILIGFSSYSLIFIRSGADTPIDMNNPEDINAFLSYMRREQYGDRPLAYGTLYNGQVIDFVSGEMRYISVAGERRYVEDTERTHYLYQPEDYVFFPRMYEASKYLAGPYGYANYVKDKGADPNNPMDDKPTRWEDFLFFWDYQLGHMYFRYFLWNFVGRASDVQDDTWESGFELGLIGSVGTPNKAQNHYYFLPLFLGMLGFVWQIFARKRDAAVLGMLFFFTGIAIILYLNQWPGQPRERDYSFAGSYQTFCIWIGLGVLFCMEWLKGLVGKNGVYFAGGLCLLVPGIMGLENWDDHTRKGRYIDRDFAYNLLQTCAPNAILFTGGDNDTFPVWYLQEVEGIRTDVRIVNLELLISDWYINQMRAPQNGAPGIPLAIAPEEYQGERDIVIRGVNSQQIALPIDRKALIQNGTLTPQEASWATDTMFWDFPTRGSSQNPYILRKDLIMLDLIQQVAADNWNRPIYFASMMAPDSYLGLEDFFKMEGLAYRLVPVRQSEATPADMYHGWIGQETMYNNLTGTYLYRGLDNPHVYFDEHIRQVIIGASYQNAFYRLARSYSENIKKAQNNLAIYQLSLSYPASWQDTLENFIAEQTQALVASAESEAEMDFSLITQIELAQNLLDEEVDSPDSFSSQIEQLEASISTDTEKLQELLAFLDTHIPARSIAPTYADWAMRIQIYEIAGMEAPMLEAVDRLVAKGLAEVEALANSYVELSPNETAFTAVFMGIQYYQRAGEAEKARQVADTLEALIGDPRGKQLLE